MKRLLQAALTAAPSFAASFSIDLVQVAKAVKARHDQIPARVKWRRATAAFAAAASVGDITTTYQGIRRGGCELNPFLQLADGCSLNKARFNRMKIGMFIWLGPGQELMHKLPHSAFWDRENIVLNVITGAVYTGVTINNARQ